MTDANIAIAWRGIAAKSLCLLLALAPGLLAGQVLAPASGASEQAEGLVYSEASTFNQQVFVVDEDGLRSMRFASLRGEDQTRIRPGHPEELPMPYLRSAAAGLGVPEKLERILVVGLGGGAFPSFVQALAPGVAVDGVEIDPVVARIAQDYFDLRITQQLRVHVRDAVEYVKQPHAPYDYILLDAYDAEDLPDALATPSFFRDVRHLLDEEDGVVVVNIAIRGAVRTDAMIRTLTSTFGHCVHLRSPPSLNDVLLLAKQPLPQRDKLLDRLTELGASPSVRDHVSAQLAAAKPCLS